MAGKKAKQQFDKNPVEAARNPFEDIGFKDIKKALTQEAKMDLNSAWEMMLGVGSFKLSGDMVEGQEIDLRAKKEQGKQKAEKRAEGGIDYVSEILHGEKRITRREQGELTNKIDQLIDELHKLAKSSKTLETQFKEVVVEQRPVTPGKYHLNFFEWMLSVVRAASVKVEESGNWLSVMGAKKSKKDYWGMAKKHGTSFSLSGERVVSTQVG
jgi:hypothetical protein